jgi:hypothetical protein
MQNMIKLSRNLYMLAIHYNIGLNVLQKVACYQNHDRRSQEHHTNIGVMQTPLDTSITSTIAFSSLINQSISSYSIEMTRQTHHDQLTLHLQQTSKKKKRYYCPRSESNRRPCQPILGCLYPWMPASFVGRPAGYLSNVINHLTTGAFFWILGTRAKDAM